MPGVLGAILNDKLRRVQTKTTSWHVKKPEKSEAVSEVKHRHGNSAANLKCARVNKSIIYIIVRKEKAPIY